MATKNQFYWIATIGWMILISWFSINPVKGTGIVGVIARIPDIFLHISVYIVLTALLFFSLKGIHFKHALPTSMIFAISYGIVLELLQFMIPYRTSTFLDVCMNGAGVLIAGVVLYKNSLIFTKKH